MSILESNYILAYRLSGKFMLIILEYRSKMAGRSIVVILPYYETTESVRQVILENCGNGI
jgi:hypothetical protein